MKNNKKTLNIILFGIIALVGFGIYLTACQLVPRGGLYIYPDGDPSLDQLIALDPDMAGIFLAIVALGIVAWIVRLALVSVPLYKTGIKGNNATVLAFDIISIVMLLSVLLGVLLPIGQPYYALFPTWEMDAEPSAYYYVLVNMTIYVAPIILVSALVSGIVYNNLDKKLCPINTMLFGITTALCFSVIIPIASLASDLYSDTRDGAIVTLSMEWKLAGVFFAFILMCLVAQIVRFILVSIPSFKKGGLHGNNVAILVFDIITFVMLIAMLAALFLPTGTYDYADPAARELLSDKRLAAQIIASYAPAIGTISSLVSGVVANHLGK